MAEPKDMILPLLRKIESKSEQRHKEVIDRLDKLEQTQISFRHALSADTLMSKLVTGEFEERIELLERKVKDLELYK